LLHSVQRYQERGKNCSKISALSLARKGNNEKETEKEKEKEKKNNNKQTGLVS